MKIILSIFLLPYRTILYLLLRLRLLFKSSGNHYLIKVPQAFSTVIKSSVYRWLSDKEEPPFLIDYLNNLKLIIGSSAKKVSFYIGEIDFGYSELFQLTSVVQEMNAKGIITSGYAESGNLKTLYLLSFMKEKYSSPLSEFHVLLPSVETFFFGDLLSDKLKVNVDSFTSGDFKSLAEPFQRNSFSDAARDNLVDLIESLKSKITNDFSANTSIKESILEIPIQSSGSLKEKGFFTALLDEEDFLNNHLYKDYINPNLNKEDPPKKEEEEKEPDYTEGSISYLKLRKKIRNFYFLYKKKLKIAILPLKGNIVEGGDEDIGNEENNINGQAIKKLIRELREDDTVAGVILEIDSGGGSAYASELIHWELVKLSQKKPLYAYFQNTAASGGYYIATACNEIHSSPFCITGSIGVVSMRPNLKGLYNKFGVYKDRIGFYPLRDVFSEYGKLLPGSREFMEQEVVRINELFYRRVMDSRKTTREEMDLLGEGRVFTAMQFLEEQMVDSNSTLLDIMDKMKSLVKDAKVDFYYLPAEYGIKSFVKDFQVAFRVVRSIRQIRNNLKNNNTIQLSLSSIYKIKDK